jgi:hypothetical protein
VSASRWLCFLGRTQFLPLICDIFPCLSQFSPTLPGCARPVLCRLALNLVQTVCTESFLHVSPVHHSCFLCSTTIFCYITVALIPSQYYLVKIYYWSKWKRRNYSRYNRYQKSCVRKLWDQLLNIYNSHHTSFSTGPPHCWIIHSLSVRLTNGLARFGGR